MLFRFLYLPQITTLNKKLSDQTPVNIYLNIVVLRSVGRDFLERSVSYRLLINYSLYGHLLPIKEKHLKESFSSDLPITAKFTKYRVNTFQSTW